MSVLSAVNELGAVFLAAWTGIIVARTRWRVQAVGTTRTGVNYYHLTIRTLIFTILLTCAFAWVML